MAYTYEISVSIKDVSTGQEVFGAPLTHRITCDEMIGPARYERTTGGGYVALPTSVLDEVQLLVVRPDKQMTFRLDGQTDAGVVINANGMLVAVDVDIDAAAATNVTADNSSGATALLQAFAAGT